MAFRRDQNRGSRDGGFRPRFSDRESRGPVEMHRATCDACGKQCEVPFRPTSGKPVFCSSCFEHKGGSDSRRFEGRGREEERQLFEAVCADCGNKCQVPFRPTQDKPVFCSDCFGEKKHAGGESGGKDKFAELNAKLDKILSLLSPASVEKVNPAPADVAEKPVKVSKRKPKVKVLVAEEAKDESAEQGRSEITPEESIDA